MLRHAYLLFLPILMSAQNLRVVNAASFLDSDAVVPGSVISVLGFNGLTGTFIAPSPDNLPTSLGGVTLKIGNVPLSLFYVAPNQINAQIDPKTPLGSDILTVATPSGTTAIKVLVSGSSTPGLFSFAGSGTRDAAVLNGLTYARGPFTVTTSNQPTYLAIYATGLDVSKTPKITIGGLSVPVLYAGAPPCCTGLQQINVQLVPSLAGAGRVELALTDGSGKTSNIVEIVILPNPGQGAFPPSAEGLARSRELANLAWVPGTSTVLIADEADDVLRLIDVKKSATLATITLPEGSQPVSTAVTADGQTAVIAERARGKVAIVDLAKKTVLLEVPVGLGPTAVAISGSTAVVVNQDVDSVSLVDLKTGKVKTTLAVKRGPRSVAVDPAASLGYVVNQDSGSISVIDLSAGTVVRTLDLGVNSRPQSIEYLASLKLLLVTEPSSSLGSRISAVDPTTGTIFPTGISVIGGSGLDAVVVVGATVYAASPVSGTVVAATASLVKGLPVFTNIEIPVALGPRALAVDILDKLLVVANQGEGTLSLIDLTSNKLVGKVSGVQSEIEGNGPQNDRSDREQAQNAPNVASVTPAVLAVGTTATLTVKGTNLTGSPDLWFFIPSNGNSNGQGNGNGFGSIARADETIAVSKVVTASDGKSLTCTVTVSAKAVAGVRVLRVGNENGSSSSKTSAGNSVQIK